MTPTPLKPLYKVVCRDDAGDLVEATSLRFPTLTGAVEYLRTVSPARHPEVALHSLVAGGQK